MPNFLLRAANLQDSELLFRLMQYYYFEATKWSGEELGADGLFDCELTDVRASLEAPGQWAYLLYCDSQIAGFVLVDEAELEGQTYPELADLFVLPKYRGKGLAAYAVGQIITADQAPWLMAVYLDDAQAYHHWQRSLPRLGMSHIEQPRSADAKFHLFLVTPAEALQG